VRIAFAGTPPFAARALEHLIEAASAASFNIVLVLSQPDRPAGRGMKVAPSAVKALAMAHGMPVLCPASLNLKRGAEASEAHAALHAAQPDVLVVAAYGLILPQAVLDIPRGVPLGGGERATALNIHASLLPRWRGAAPVARAIEAGDVATGITIMQMDAGLDTGPMLLAEPTPIGADESAGALTARLAEVGGRLIVQALRGAAQGTLRPLAQPAQGVTYAHKLDKQEAWLDWRRPAAELARRVRAFDPFPGTAALCLAGAVADRAVLVGQGAAFDAARLAGAPTIKIWSAHAVDAGAGRRADVGTDAAAKGAAAMRTPAAAGDGATVNRPGPWSPGEVVHADADGVRIACGPTGEELLVATLLQRAGARRLPAREFLAGTALQPGDRLVAPVAPLTAAPP
jgi:methionyl-tRNA formyltransferase